MNLYHCMIDLKNDAKAMTFAKALTDWMEHLTQKGQVSSWRLLRRKLNLTSDSHRDFILEVEVDGMEGLDHVFRYVCSQSDEVEHLYSQVHSLIAKVDYGLYRPFPDPERVERVALL